jgi:hypothetical protein
MNRVEKLRLRYRPDVISVLFVGESAPRSGRFFYDDDRPSPLRRRTERLMRESLSGRIDHDFLRSFQRLGLFLDDICLEPINHLCPSDKRRKCREWEPDLGRRLIAAAPQMIVGIGTTRRRNLERARAAAGIGAPFEVMTFPNRPDQIERYEAELPALLNRLDRQGLLLGW